MFKRNVLQKLSWLLGNKLTILLVVMMAAPQPSMGLLGKSKKKKAKEKAEKALQEEEAAQAKVQEETAAQETQPEPERERPRQTYSNEYERDRAAIIKIRKRLEAMFLGSNHVFPDEDNEGARIYIDALLSIPEDFILRGKIPTGWVELPVAGPSATMKTLIFKTVSDMLVKAGLLNEQRKYFHQAEAGRDIDPNFLIGLGVSDEVIKKFVGADAINGYSDVSTYSSDKHDVFLKMFAMIGQDESTHRDNLPDTIEEAYEMAFKKVAEEYGELDEEEIDKRLARVQEPQMPEDENDAAAMKQWRSDMIAYEMQKLRDSRERKQDTMSFEEALRQAKYNVQMRWEARDKNIAFAKQKWQATSGGTVREAKFIPINPALKKELTELEEETAKLKTKFLEIGQMANSDVLKQAVELVPKLKSENEATQRAMEEKSQDVEIYDLQEGLFSELTPYQVYSWLRKNDHLRAFDMNDFDPSNQSSDAAMIRQLIEDLTEHPEEFISEGASLGKRLKNYSQAWKIARKISIWRSGRALRSRVAKAGTETDEDTPAVKGIESVKDRELKRHEKTVNIDWEDRHIGKVKKKMNKAVADYTRKQKGTMIADVSRARSRIEENNKKIAQIEEQARNLQELIDHTAKEAEKKKAELEAARARGEDVEELRILTSQDALKELERLEEKMHILLKRAAKSESVQQAIRAEITNMNVTDLRENYPDHYHWLTKVMQANPGDYLHNLKASNDIELMTDHLYRMSPKRFKRLTVSMMKDGGVETTSTHFGLIKVDLMNVRQIEDDVMDCMKDRDQTWADYAECYEIVLAKPEHKEWVLRYHQEFNKEFVNQGGTPFATGRRLEGKRGAIFLLPPGPKRVANQAARALLFDFSEMQEQLKNNSIRDLDLKLHVDKNIALALVKKTDKATLGLDPVLTKVNGIMAKLLGDLEPQIQEMRKNSEQLTGHLSLTLEESTSPNGGTVIALRWLPSDMDGSPLEDAPVFDPLDPNMKFNELELPKGNLVSEIPLNIRPEEMYFLEGEGAEREWSITAPDGTTVKYKEKDPNKMDPGHPGLIQILSKSYFMDRVNNRIGRTDAESQAFADARAEEAKARQQRLEEERGELDFIQGDSRDSNIPKKVDIYGDLPKIPSKASKVWKYGKWLGGPVTAIWVGVGKLFSSKPTDEERREIRKQEQRLRLMYEARDIWFKIHFPNGVLGPRSFYSGTEPDDEFYHYYLAQKEFRSWVKQPGVTPDDLEEYYKSWNEYVDRYNAWERNRRTTERRAETARLDGAEESEVDGILNRIGDRPEMTHPCVGLMSGND